MFKMTMTLYAALPLESGHVKLYWPATYTHRSSLNRFWESVDLGMAWEKPNRDLMGSDFPQHVLRFEIEARPSGLPYM